MTNTLRDELAAIIAESIFTTHGFASSQPMTEAAQAIVGHLTPILEGAEWALKHHHEIATVRHEKKYLESNTGKDTEFVLAKLRALLGKGGV